MASDFVDNIYAWGFAADGETERALRAGLTGHNVKIQRGRLPVALRTLATEPASRLVFVDLDGVLEPGTAAEELTAVCAFDTALIAIGSTDTAHFARALVQHGMEDYLIKPISASLIRQAGAMAVGDLPERSYAGRVIAFVGSAGSGISTLIAAVARSVTADGRTVSVVDLDPVSGKLSALLDVEPVDDLPALLAAHDFDELSGSDRFVNPSQVDRIFALAPSGVLLLTYPPTVPPPPSPLSVCMLLRRLANRTHVVLVTGIPPDLRVDTMQQVDDTVLLYEPTLLSINVIVRHLSLVGAEHLATLVQCSPRIPTSTLSPADIRYTLAGRHPDVVIPFESTLHAASTGKESGHPSKAYRKALHQVIQRVVDF